MSRSNLPPRPSDYRMPVFMNDVPNEAEDEAEEMALRHGVDEPRDEAKKKAEAAAKRKAEAAAKKAAAEQAKQAREPEPPSDAEAQPEATEGSEAPEA